MLAHFLLPAYGQDKSGGNEPWRSTLPCIDPFRHAPTSRARGSPVLMLAMVVIAIAALYFGRDIFVPAGARDAVELRARPRRPPAPPAACPQPPGGAQRRRPRLPAHLRARRGRRLAGDRPRRTPPDLPLEHRDEDRFGAPGAAGRTLFERATEMVRDLGRKIEQEDSKAAAENDDERARPPATPRRRSRSRSISRRRPRCRSSPRSSGRFSVRSPPPAS